MSKEYDYRKVYDEFWKDIIEKDGVVSMEQIKKELGDFKIFCIDQLPELYDYISNGTVSKIQTDIIHLKQFHDDACSISISDFCQELLDHINDTYKEKERINMLSVIDYLKDGLV